jgi:hypothetical protein
VRGETLSMSAGRGVSWKDEVWNLELILRAKPVSEHKDASLWCRTKVRTIGLSLHLPSSYIFIFTIHGMLLCILAKAGGP